MQWLAHPNTLQQLQAQFDTPHTGTALGLSLALLLLHALLAWALCRLTHEAQRRGLSLLQRWAWPMLVLLLNTVLLLLVQHPAAGHLLSQQLHPEPFQLANSLLVARLLALSITHLLQRSFASQRWVRPWSNLLAGLVWMAAALQMSGLLPPLTEELNSTMLVVGKYHVSVLQMMEGLLSVVVMILASLWLGSLLEVRIMANAEVDLNTRVMISKLAKSLLTLVGVMVALPLAGIDLSMLAVFGGALGVGLGFGLQKIASNYVSGFIVLFERSIRLGDVISVGERQGVVTRHTTRYLVLKGMDGSEALIPNETLISSTVVNQSYSDRKVRQALRLHLSYDSDVALAQSLLLATARAHARTLSEPPPQVFLVGFTDQGLELELGCWLGDPENGSLSYRSELNLEILQQLRAHQLQLAVPSKEARLIPSSLPLPPSAPGQLATPGSPS